MIRVAIIGLGRWGKKLVPVFSRCSDLVLCCNQSEIKDQKWLKEHYPNVRASFDLDEALGNDLIDAVVIATPIATHADLAGRALRAGKHVFVEKPLAMSVSESRQLVNAAREASLQLFIGHTFLYHPAFNELLHQTNGDPIRHLQLYWFKLGTFEENLIWNLASHDIAMTLKIFGERPEELAILHRKGAYTDMDFLSLWLAFSRERSCHIVIDRCSPSTRKTLTAVTLSGSVFSWERNTLYGLAKDANYKPIYENLEDPLSIEVNAFLQSIENKEKTESEGEFNLQIVEVLEALAKSTRGLQ